MSATQRLKRVVCLGDSITRGQVSVNYVELLRQRLSAERFGFANHGVNYDLAYNALARLDDVLADEPDHVTVLLGTNDANASLHERNRKRLTRVRRLPTRPTREWYRANLTELVRRLQQHSHADVAVLSLPVIGEQLDSESVRRAGEYSAVVREVAESNGAAYLPLYERQVEELRRHDRRPGTP